MTTTIRCQVTLVGPCKSGKTSLAQVFYGKQCPKQYIMTNPVDYIISAVKQASPPSNSPSSTTTSTPQSSNKYTVELHLFDTSGHTVHAEMRTALCQGTDAILAVYDITSSESLRQAVIQADEAVRASGKDPADVLGVLIGNKNDLRDVEEVTEKEGDEMAKQMVGQFSHVRTSALDGYNVDTAFNTIASHFLTLFENTAQKYKEAL